MTAATDTMILEQLMGINKKLGEVDAKLAAGAELHKAMGQQIDMIDRRTDICETKTVKIEEILVPTDGMTKPLVERIKVLETFHGKVGAMVVTAWGLLCGAGYLIYWGIGTFHNEIKDWFMGFWRH